MPICFISLRYILRSGIVGSDSNYMLNILRTTIAFLNFLHNFGFPSVISGGSKFSKSLPTLVAFL